MRNPYDNLDDFCFWSRAMTKPGPSQIDPCVSAWKIKQKHRVATMGSCFAQHLARHIRAAGLDYFVPETGPSTVTDTERARRNFGVFSARYGNIYTVKQLLQLFDRAFGRFHPKDSCWDRDGRLVDAFRPQVEPDGFASEEILESDRDEHLACVRRVFTESDFIIVTLGLTEGWRSKHDGAVYPIAPGVSGGNFDPTKYEFINFTTAETEQDLATFVEKVKEINLHAKIILTVSPVPLIATYENRHVWVSTTFSKAALRVAADGVERRFSNVVYFPSLEIITSPAAGGRYYGDDLRQVTEIGVKHVMRVFSQHFFNEKHGQSDLSDNQAISQHMMDDAGVVCDEEVIELALQQGHA